MKLSRKIKHLRKPSPRRKSFATGRLIRPELLFGIARFEGFTKDIAK
jgi:hypothetical protein